MHLVVLRVRNFDLPNELPPQLQPHAPLIQLTTENTSNNPSTVLNIGNIEKKVEVSK
jgi:hypothetical protein